MNEYDENIIRKMLLENGYVEVEGIKEADAVIYLTCGVREHAEKRALGRVVSESNGKLRIIAGCLARLYGEKLIRNKIADVVVGPDNYKEIPKILKKFEDAREPIVAIEEKKEIYEGILPEVKNGAVSSYVTVMRGCNNFCSYCVVPYLRGRERFKPIEHVAREVENLVARGIKEIFLIGQNVMAYRDNEKDFADVVEEVAQIDGLKRVGFLTSHPKDVTFSIIERLAKIDKLVTYFHVPLQAGSKRILELMNRKYTPDDYLRLIDFIREKFKDPFISSDIIVGFPTETEEDFKETVKIVEKVEFDSLYMFAYSERPFIKARLLEPKVDEKAKKERLNYLIELQNSIIKKKVKALVGRVEKVFVVGEAKKGGMLGKMCNNRMVVINDTVEKGKEVMVRIEEIKGWTPIGRLKWE